MNLERSRAMARRTNLDFGMAELQTLDDFLKWIYNEGYFLTDKGEEDAKTAVPLTKRGKTEMMNLVDSMIDIYVNSMTVSLMYVNGAPGMEEKCGEIQKNIVEAMSKSDTIRKAMREFLAKQEEEEDGKNEVDEG